jgi:hypothetical protein
VNVLPVIEGLLTAELKLEKGPEETGLLGFPRFKLVM